MTSFFDYFIGYTVSLHVEAQRMMEELNTFEGGRGLVLTLRWDIDGAERQRLREINRAGNDAKHDNLAWDADWTWA